MRSKIMRQRESLVLYKLLNTLRSAEICCVELILTLFNGKGLLITFYGVNIFLRDLHLRTSIEHLCFFVYYFYKYLITLNTCVTFKMVNENSRLRLRLLLLISPWAAIPSPKLEVPIWGYESIPGTEPGIE
jgi:hypothetical protein